eukprot:9418168-Prorocentrum_lima.AAC.1
MKVGRGAASWPSPCVLVGAEVAGIAAAKLISRPGGERREPKSAEKKPWWDSRCDCFPCPQGES